MPSQCIVLSRGGGGPPSAPRQVSLAAAASFFGLKPSGRTARTCLSPHKASSSNNKETSIAIHYTTSSLPTQIITHRTEITDNTPREQTHTHEISSAHIMGDRRVRVLCGIAAGVATGCALLGVYLCKRSLPARSHEKAKELIEHDGGKAVRSTDGLRTVEYFVAGSMLPTARVCIIFSGAAVTAKYVAHLVHATAERLNTRVIAITLPGWGYSTFHRRLVYCVWAATDLKPILEAEKVRRFAVAGTSLGCRLRWRSPPRSAHRTSWPSDCVSPSCRRRCRRGGPPRVPGAPARHAAVGRPAYGWATHLAMLPLPSMAHWRVRLAPPWCSVQEAGVTIPMSLTSPIMT